MTEQERADLREILAALEMPRHSLRAWMSQLDRFCLRHGGDRTYRELRVLLADCQDELAAEEP